MKATERFTNRVSDYKNHRPGYPKAIIDRLLAQRIITSASVVADIGSGTGLFCKLFFPFVEQVYGVEPNDAMRRQAEADFSSVTNFISRPGSAEDTHLASHSIDLVTAAQSFHWFNREKTYTEFKRILKPSGRVLLVWNYRDIDGDELQRRYEAILASTIPNYKQLDHKSMTLDKIKAFFKSPSVDCFSLPNQQSFTLDQFKGRILSSSYVPKPPDPVYDSVMDQVVDLFHEFEKEKSILFIYKTVVYTGIPS